jgi:hydroxymethylbilane synthase
MTDLPPKVILATRKSPLALKQADLASSVLLETLGFEVETLPLSTTGDQRLEWSLEQEGGKGLFTKELEAALLEGRADVAVHSAKDLPTEMPSGLALAGYLPREDPRDVLVARADVARPKVIATGSPRRRAQLLATHWSDAETKEIRGNVETRLRKIAEDHEADATVLASAGLIRLGIEDFPGLRFEHLPIEEMVPAPGQAAIALQVREADLDRFKAACDTVTAEAVDFERAVLATMGGGCQVAVGVHRQGDSLFIFHKDEHSRIDLSGLPYSSALERALSIFGQE